ncbi:MAG TPA: hypothetical protein VI913_04795 [Candidatus Peribacteraceae bacterium]|nr:hypothetical protein [Candidatus Peribacteraceae bacterium]
MKTLIRIGNLVFGLGLLSVSSLAHAQGRSLLCYALPGGCPPTTIDSLISVFRAGAVFLLDLVAGVSMFFIIWGGLLMIASMGDESKFGTGRTSIIYACLGLAVALSADIFLNILTPIGNAGDFQGAALQVLAIPITLLNIVFSVVIVLTAFRLVLARGKSDEVETSRKMLIYAIIGAIIVNLAKAIYTSVANIFI